uniref:Uncharacterized protein n=1 Tax=Tetranychus urticae TaxID=32264 RepID=T1KPB3_TETUR
MSIEKFKGLKYKHAALLSVWLTCRISSLILVKLMIEN